MDEFNINIGDTLRCQEHGRMVTYVVRHVNRYRGFVEGVILNDDESMVSAFGMTADTWLRITDV